METDHSDITIGPGKLLGLFFMLVMICGVFFAIGYSLGRTSAREQALNGKASLNASLTAPVMGDASAPKPSAVVPAKGDADASTASEQEKTPTGPDLTFFNAVKKRDSAQAIPQETGKTVSAKAEPPKPSDTPPGRAVTVAATAPATTVTDNTVGLTAPASADSKTAVASVSGGAFVVQIAAVTREEDAAALAGALRKKNYSVFVVNNPAVHDKFYHVQVGPFTTLQDAETMKAKLSGEGYNSIVKKS